MKSWVFWLQKNLIPPLPIFLSCQGEIKNSYWLLFKQYILAHIILSQLKDSFRSGWINLLFLALGMLLTQFIVSFLGSSDLKERNAKDRDQQESSRGHKDLSHLKKQNKKMGKKCPTKRAPNLGDPAAFFVAFFGAFESFPVSAGKTPPPHPKAEKHKPVEVA